MKNLSVVILSFIVVQLSALPSWALREKAFMACYDQSVQNLLDIASSGHEINAEELTRRVGFLRVVSSFMMGPDATELSRLRKALYDSYSCEEFVEMASVSSEDSPDKMYFTGDKCTDGTMPTRDMLFNLNVTTSTLLMNAPMSLKELQYGRATTLWGNVDCRQMDASFTKMAIDTLQENRSYVKELYQLL